MQRFLQLIVSSKFFEDVTFRNNFYALYEDYLLAPPSAQTQKNFLEALIEFIRVHGNESLFNAVRGAYRQTMQEISEEHRLQIHPYSGWHPFIEKIQLYENGKVLSDNAITNLHSEHQDVSSIKLDQQVILNLNQRPYALITSLGKGKFGEVFLAQDLFSGEWCAVKKIQLNHPNFEAKDIFVIYKNEVEALQELNELKNHAVDKAHDVAYIAMKFELGISLKQLKDRQAPAFIWFTRFISMLESIQSLHQKSILHGDLSLDNLLCDVDNIISIIDKGLAKKTSKSDTVLLEKSSVVSHHYSMLASEVRYKHKLTPKTEVCVAGFLIAELLDLLEKQSMHNYVSVNTNVTSIKKLNLSHEGSKAVVQSIANMTDEKKKARPSLDEAIQKMRQLRAKYSNEILAKFVKTGFVSLDEILSRKGLLLPALLAVDQVYILVPQSYTDPIYSLLNTLSRAGVRIAGFVVHDSDLLPMQVAQQTDSELSNRNRLIIHSSFLLTTTEQNLNTNMKIMPITVSSAKTKQDYEKEMTLSSALTVEQFILVTEDIRQEIARFEEKYPSNKYNNDQSDTGKTINARKQNLNHFLHELTSLYQEGDVKVAYVIEKLNELQQIMTHTSTLKKNLANLFSISQNPTGAANIVKIRENLTGPITSIKLPKKP